LGRNSTRRVQKKGKKKKVKPATCQGRETNGVARKKIMQYNPALNEGGRRVQSPTFDATRESVGIRENTGSAQTKQTRRGSGRKMPTGLATGLTQQTGAKFANFRQLTKARLGAT